MRQRAGKVSAPRHRIVLWRIRHVDDWWAKRGELEGVGRPLCHSVVHWRHGSQIGHDCDEVIIRKAAVDSERHGRTD
jgi:hypothetical protein